MPYPLHQPISIATGEKLDTPCRRDGVFVDERRGRADVLIVDERAAFDPATQVATDSEGAEPWPFDPAATRWRLRRTVRSKTAEELAAAQELGVQVRLDAFRGDRGAVLRAILNAERASRLPPVPALSEEEFLAFCRAALGV